MDATIQVRQRGTLTLPAELRDKYRIGVGDTVRIVDLDGILVLTPMVPMVSELAREIERARLAAALREGCPWLVTFNVRHYRPGHPQVTVLRPGDLILRVRDLLAGLASQGKHERSSTVQR